MHTAVKRFYRQGEKVYISEKVTGFFKLLEKFIPDIIGSEFFDENDERRKEIRHENVEKLSFDSESIDLYISNDVLEHVFDYKSALSEAYRILRDGGVFLFHIPFHSHTQIAIISFLYLLSFSKIVYDISMFIKEITYVSVD